MSSKIFSATNIGLSSHLIDVEADITNSNTNFLIVGLPDAAVQEARERVKSAIKNSNLSFPRTKVTVNLAPADLKKIGPAFDLPIATAILATKGLVTLSQEDQQAVFIGELSLNGSLRQVSGILNICAHLAKWQLKRIYLPEKNLNEAKLIGGLEIYPLKNLACLVDHLTGRKKIQPVISKEARLPNLKPGELNSFSLIKGQKHAKRALAIAAAGGHNLLMVGPPGSGKTLLAQSLAELLPPLTIEESLEVSRIYSLAGQMSAEKPLIVNRPFRSPHHTSSGVALIGGGSFPKPGEITLAHRGVLFLDELTEFPKAVLENLRQPLEKGRVTISRAATSVEFPSRFILIAAANPCPCGYVTDPERNCQCTPLQIQHYQKKISGPILDRIDLHLSVPRLATEELMTKKTDDSWKNLAAKIIQAQKIQQQRFKKFSFSYNAEINFKVIEHFCQISSEAEKLLKQATVKLKLSARSYHKILKVSRTIADLEQSPGIEAVHLAESLQYRQNVFDS